MEIRRMEAADLDAAADVYMKAYGSDLGKDKAKQYLDKFHSFEPERCFVAIRPDGSLAGAALGFSYEKEGGPVLFIQELFVDPAEQGQGTGKKLVAKLRDTVEESSEVHIKPLVKADTRVLNFYNSLGFERYKAVSFSFED